MADKSPQAFRTIREVADWLGIEAHVLRFWESKFSQVKPVKRAGGRRYYRPSDMRLIGGIKVLLHDQGLTIRGVQKKIREEGVAEIAALSPPLEEELDLQASNTLDSVPAEATEAQAAPVSGFMDIDALAGEAEEAGETDEAKDQAEAAEISEPEPEPEPQPEPELQPDPEPEPEAAAPSESTATPAVAAPAPQDAAPTTPLSEIRVLLHRAVPLSPSQKAELGPIVARLELLAERLRTGHRAE